MPLTTERPTQRMGDAPVITIVEPPVKANTKIYAGALVVIDAGYAAPGRAALNLIPLGRAEETVDNSTGAAGAKRVRVRRGAFKWKNSAGADAIAQADVFKDAFIVDDETVAKTDGAGARSKAGKILAVDSDGVWIETY